MTPLPTFSSSSSARAALAAALLAAAIVAPSRAHEGHDHADEAPVSATPSPSGPRFAAVGDRFELVGALDGRRLLLWLDGADDNAPVAGASIELDVAGESIAARAEGGVYVAELARVPAPGRLPVAATVVAGDASDLLAAELLVEPPAAAPAGATRTAAPARTEGPWTTVAIAAAAAAAAGALGWGAARRRGAGVRG